MILYHGTNVSSALNILANGFNFNSTGTNWGSTYGKAIYFTPNYKTAQCYAGDDGIIFSIDVEVNDFLILEKFKSPSSRKQLQCMSKWLITPNFDEYIMLY